MLIGETGADAHGKEGEAILWTMANRLYKLRHTSFEDRSGNVYKPPHRYSQILRSYSSPINPYWRERGTPETRERRLRFATMDWYDADPRVIDLVVRFMSGQVPIRREFVGLVHFSECECGAGCGRHLHGPEDYVIDNCFWKASDTRGWTTETLKPTKPRPTSAAVPVIAGIGAIALYLGFRKLTG